MPNPYEDYDVAGKEVSSTYEGRHITFPESYFNHPTHADNLVDGKDPVTFGTVPDGYGVGVAFSSASGVNDLIAVDTEGIWALTAYALNDEGASAIEIGDIIYINRTTCVLSKISSDTTNLVFGYALTTLAQGSGVVVIKVHWAPHRDDVYRDYLAGGAAEDALLIDVDDATTLATGYGQGLYVVYRNTGDKTGSAEVHPISADLFVTGDVPYAYVYTSYLSATGNPAIGQAAGFSIHVDELGTGVSERTPLDVGKVSTNAAAGRDTFQRIREHGTLLGDSVFLLEGPNNVGTATYLIDMATGAGNALPFILAAVGGAQTAKIAVRWNGVDYFIPLNTA